ncbi:MULTISPECIES: Crp/Fnr family transcriptional regulator [Methylorubrum]|uniref:CRP-like cAMP-binding protein n=1 Tax=Methylorubrum thiocyanatum TaxID=47958 RepID=A0AA40VDK1_9HYPH|nr:MULTISPECIES: Crp/Fnr family transcriptional regulator [Methylorubrum]MBA8916032.1 CRP-like cAMP-binding protein [Methylorubrum thiocyanatum]GMA80086.1 transcriptional regulator [Methylorubrum aminovorans]
MKVTTYAYVSAAQLVRVVAVPKGQGGREMQLLRQGAHGPLVRKLEAFAPLQVTDRVALTAIETAGQFFPAGKDLICEGDRPQGMLVIGQGFACQYKLRENGTRQILAYLLPGDVCDLATSRLDRMDYAIGTLSTCRAVWVAPWIVADLQRRPAVMQALQTAARVNEATLRAWLVNIGCRSAVERLAHLFCELYVRLRAVGLTKDQTFLLPITQVDLADTAGITPVHVNRSLGTLRRAGLIERKGRHFTILDLPRLAEIAEFKANYLQLDEMASERDRSTSQQLRAIGPHPHVSEAQPRTF